MRPQGRGRRQHGGGRQRRNTPLGWQTRFPLPNDVAATLTAQRGRCDNLGLWLDRFIDWTDQDERERDVELQPVMATKKRQAPMLTRNVDRVLEMQKVTSLVESCYARSQQQIEAFKQRGYCVPEPIVAAPDYRLVVGFGAEHVLETNLCLHRIYGFPIIPGSAVKGVTRAWAFWEIAERLHVPAVDAEEAERREKAKERTPLQLLDQLLSDGTEKAQEKTLARLKADALCSNAAALNSLDVQSWQALARDFYNVFGTTDQRGQVIFFDAYPTQAPKLELDILNPHYGKYYQGNDPPADYLTPMPTYFLTVAKDTEFQFAIASKDPALAAKAEEWLKNALSQLGIGGKTSSGYGYFVLPSTSIQGEEQDANDTMEKLAKAGFKVRKA